jgi:uncharacterized protein (DUF1330 family)
MGFAHGAIAVQALHAQSMPPNYYIAEVDVTELEGYVKEFVPKAAASAEAYGGHALAAGQKVIPIEGPPPKRRVVVMRWDSLQQLRAWRDSPRYKEDRKIADKYVASPGVRC